MSAPLMQDGRNVRFAGALHRANGTRTHYTTKDGKLSSAVASPPSRAPPQQESLPPCCSGMRLGPRKCCSDHGSATGTLISCHWTVCCSSCDSASPCQLSRSIHPPHWKLISSELHGQQEWRIPPPEESFPHTLAHSPHCACVSRRDDTRLDIPRLLGSRNSQS